MQVENLIINVPIFLQKVSLPENEKSLDRYFNAIPGNRFGSIFIDKNAQKATFDNLAMYVQEYNESLPKYWNMILDNNIKVKNVYRKGFSSVQIKCLNVFAFNNWNRPNQIPKEEWKLSPYDHKKSSELKPINCYNYNNLVKEFNDHYGPCLYMVKPQSIKDCNLNVFKKLLYWYTGKCYHISKNFNHLKNYNILLPEMEFNAYNLTISKRSNGARESISCNKTIYNSRIRLEEAGVLVLGAFHGSKSPRTVYFNPQILVVCDKNYHQKPFIDNQSLSNNNRKELPNRCESTITLNNIKDNGRINDSLSLNLLNDFYINTPLQAHKKNNSQAVALIDLPPNERASQVRLNSIKRVQELALELNKGEYFDHRPLNLDHLHQEAVSGTLTREEFRDFLSQEFLKLSSCLWKEQNAYAGAWNKAIKVVTATFFKANGKLVSKLKMNDHYDNHVKTIQFIINYRADHPDYNLTFPNIYFDPNNIRKEDGSYFIGWKLRYFEEKQAEKTKGLLDLSIKKRKSREFRASRITKMKVIVRKFLRKEITYEFLYFEVLKNLAEYKNEIPAWIESESISTSVKNPLIINNNH
jgi:hypothetical protein